MTNNTLHNQALHKGFSLVEVMVGMTLGLLTVLVVMKTFSVFEFQKQTTTAGSDAQENGLMAMVQLEQDIRGAGAGLINNNVMGCTSVYSTYNGTSPAPGMPASGGFVPVSITDGGANASDTLTISTGATNSLGGIPANITVTMPPTSSEFNVSTTLGFADGQLILLMQGGTCSVMQVTQVQTSQGTLKIQHNPSVPYNIDSATATPPAYSQGASMTNLGSFTTHTYSIDANYNLQLASSTNSTTPTTTPQMSDIVRMDAQYGISSAAGAQPVSSWVDATAANGFAAPLSSANIKRIKAIKLVIVARSNKKEVTNVTSSAPTYYDVSTGTTTAINVSYLPNWQQYRYKVYTTIIPLRNVIWANV